MLEDIANYIISNQDDITFVLALIGSIGTICGWIYAFISNRKRIDIEIIDYSTPFGTAQFFIDIQNKSHSSICITSLCLLYDEHKAYCELIPKKIRGPESDLIRTPMFPLNLSPKQGCLHFFEFVDCPNTSLTSGKKVAFVIHTNRGPLKKFVTLGEKSHYLNKR